MGRTSFLLSLGIIVALLLGGFTGYTYWKSSNLTEELAVSEGALNSIKANFQELETNNFEQSLNAKEKLEELEASSIVWSEVIEAVQDTIPTRRGEPIIDILSYSGSGNSAISMSVKTNPDSREPYLDVADLIEEFDQSQNFLETFVPSIGSGNDEEGREVLSFSMATQFTNEAEENVESLPELSTEIEEEEDSVSSFLGGGDEESADLNDENTESDANADDVEVVDNPITR